MSRDADYLKSNRALRCAARAAKACERAAAACVKGARGKLDAVATWVVYDRAYGWALAWKRASQEVRRG